MGSARKLVVLPTKEDESEEAIEALERLQDALAEHHFTLYRPTHPGLSLVDWRKQLGCGHIRKHIQQGVVVLRAVETTGEVVGYLSYQSVNGATKVNHLVVLPALRGQGVGAMLFQEFFQRMEALSAEDQVSAEPLRTVWIVAAELNVHAVNWYRRLGFVATNFHIERHNGGPVCYVTLGRRLGQQVDANLSKLSIFGSEICGEQLSLELPESQLTTATVQRYDRDNGLHKLQGGIWLNLSEAFANGKVHFSRPLHEILGAPVSCATRAARRKASSRQCKRQQTEPVTPPSRSVSASLPVSSPSKELPPHFGELSAERPKVRRRLTII